MHIVLMAVGLIFRRDNSNMLCLISFTAAFMLLVQPPVFKRNQVDLDVLGRHKDFVLTEVVPLRWLHSSLIRGVCALKCCIPNTGQSPV